MRGTTKDAKKVIGKTRKIPIDRLIAIFDYLVILIAPYSEELRYTNHSCAFYAKINTLATERLLTKGQGRNEDPSTTYFRINYDQGFAEEIAAGLPNFKLSEFATVDDKDNKR